MDMKLGILILLNTAPHQNLVLASSAIIGENTVFGIPATVKLRKNCHNYGNVFSPVDLLSDIFYFLILQLVYKLSSCWISLLFYHSSVIQLLFYEHRQLYRVFSNICSNVHNDDFEKFVCLGCSDM